MYMAICKTYLVCMCLLSGKFANVGVTFFPLFSHTFSPVLSIKNGIVLLPSNVYLENWLGLCSAIFTLQAMEAVAVQLKKIQGVFWSWK